MNREEAALKQTVKFTRKDAREFLMQTVFQMDAQKELDVSHLEKYLADRKFGTQTAYVNTVLHKMLENIEEIDSMINAVSDGWSTSRMAKPDLAISRVAAAEILYADDVPQAVAINEAVNLSKLYGTEQSPKFINAVLGKIVKKLQLHLKGWLNGKRIIVNGD